METQNKMFAFEGPVQNYQQYMKEYSGHVRTTNVT